MSRAVSSSALKERKPIAQGNVPCCLSEDAPSHAREEEAELPEGWIQLLFGAKRLESSELPKEWRVQRIDNFASARGGTGFPPEYQGQTDGRYPFFKVSDMNLPGNGVWMRMSNNSVSEQVRAKLAARTFKAGTVIFPKVGGALHTNKKRVLIADSLLDNNLMGVTIDRKSVV